MADDTPTGIVSHQQHGIGKLINEINKEYQQTYNTTKQVFQETQAGDDITVNIENSTVDVTGILYGMASAPIREGNYLPGYTAAIHAASGTYEGEATTDIIQEIAVSNRANGVSIDPADGTIWANDGGEWYHYGRDGTTLIESVTPDTAVLDFHVSVDGTIWGLYDDIFQFDRAGNLLNTINTGLTSPGGITRDPTTGNIFVGDAGSGDDTIKEFTTGGTEVSSFQHAPSGRPIGLALDYTDGNLWCTVLVSGFTDYRIQKIDTTGSLIREIAQFAYIPSAPCVDPVDGGLFIDGETNIEKWNTHATAGQYDFNGRKYVVSR